MVMTDPIADFLTRIRNANMVRHESFESPSSKTKENIAAILKEEGYIKDYEIIEDDKQNVIRVFMKYTSDNQRVITNLKRISKPGLREYAKSDQIPKVLNGLGTELVSTSEGVITDKAARAKNIGGEVLAYVW